MQRVRIVSEGGTGRGTKVMLEDGTEIPAVASIAIRPIRPDAIVQAEVTLCFAALDITAHPLLSLENVREAAAHYGYRLVRDAPPRPE